MLLPLLLLLLLVLLCADRHGFGSGSGWLFSAHLWLHPSLPACQPSSPSKPACYSKFQKVSFPLKAEYSVLLGSRCWELQELWMDSLDPTKAMLINPQVQLCWLL